MTHFFKQPPALKAKSQGQATNQFINVGGEQFHALAVALIDYFKNATRVNDASLKKILERFFVYFPKYNTYFPSLITPHERMGMLINGARKSEVVNCMAYVLHQITVDEIYSHPLKYREVFDGLNANTSKGFLRQTGTRLPESALSALTQALGLTITLSFIEHGKELRKREVYVNESINGPKFEVEIQVQGNTYFPGVKNEADFAYVGQLAVKLPVPIENINEQTGTIADMLDLINSDNKRLLQLYNQWRQNLLTMVQTTGELTTEKLMNLYRTFLPEKRGIIPDPVKFFSKLSQENKKPVISSKLQESSQTNVLLANSLAGWISSNQVDADKLLDNVEKASRSTASPAA